jgi:hypothetical protein
MCIYVCIYIYMSEMLDATPGVGAFMYKHMFIRYLYKEKSLYKYIYIYIYTYIHIYIYIYEHIHKEISICS